MEPRKQITDLAVTMLTEAEMELAIRSPSIEQQMMQAQQRAAQQAVTSMDYLMMAALTAPSFRPTEAQLQQHREDLKASRRKVYQALITLMQMKPMPMLIIPKGATSPKDWEMIPAQETPEETKAQSLLADLTRDLFRVLERLADLKMMPEQEKAQMIREEMALESGWTGHSTTRCRS